VQSFVDIIWNVTRLVQQGKVLPEAYLYCWSHIEVNYSATDLTQINLEQDIKFLKNVSPYILSRDAEDIKPLTIIDVLKLYVSTIFDLYKKRSGVSFAKKPPTELTEKLMEYFTPDKEKPAPADELNSSSGAWQSKFKIHPKKTFIRHHESLNGTSTSGITDSGTIIEEAVEHSEGEQQAVCEPEPEQLISFSPFAEKMGKLASTPILIDAKSSVATSELVEETQTPEKKEPENNATRRNRIIESDDAFSFSFRYKPAEDPEANEQKVRPIVPTLPLTKSPPSSTKSGISCSVPILSFLKKPTSPVVSLFKATGQMQPPNVDIHVIPALGFSIPQPKVRAPVVGIPLPKQIGKVSPGRSLASSVISHKPVKSSHCNSDTDRAKKLKSADTTAFRKTLTAKKTKENESSDDVKSKRKTKQPHVGKLLEDTLKRLWIPKLSEHLNLYNREDIDAEANSGYIAEHRSHDLKPHSESNPVRLPKSRQSRVASPSNRGASPESISQKEHSVTTSLREALKPATSKLKQMQAKLKDTLKTSVQLRISQILPLNLRKLTSDPSAQQRGSAIIRSVIKMR
jgi:hypothetical protein